jgi:hypothetical protein
VAKFKYLGTTVTKIKITFRKKLKADEILGMLATIQLKIFLSSVFCLKMKLYKTLIFSVVLYGCETWSPTQEYR